MNRFVLLFAATLAVFAGLEGAEAGLNTLKARLAGKFGINRGHEQLGGNYYLAGQPGVHHAGYGHNHNHNHHSHQNLHQHPFHEHGLEGDSAAASSAASSGGHGQGSAAASSAATSNGGYTHQPHYGHHHQPVSAPVYRHHQTPLYAPLVSGPAPIVYHEPELHHHSVGGGAASSAAAAGNGGPGSTAASAAAAVGAQARRAAPVSRFYQAPPAVHHQYVGPQHGHLPHYVSQHTPSYGHHGGSSAASSAAAATGGSTAGGSGAATATAAAAATSTATAVEHHHVPHVDSHIVDTENFEEHFHEPETETTYATATGTFAGNGNGHEVNSYVKETEDVQKHEDGKEDDNHYYRADSYGKSSDKQKRERYNNYDEDIVHTPTVFRSKKSSTNYESDLNKAHRESGSGVLAKDKHSSSYNKNSRVFNEKIDQRNSKHGAGVVDTTAFTSHNNFNDEDDELYDSDGVGFVGVDGVAHGYTGHTGPRSAAATSSVTGNAVSTSAAIGENAAASSAAASGHH